MTASRPRIIVSATLVNSNDTKSLNAIMASLRACGADPVLVANHQNLAQEHGGIDAAVAAKIVGADGVVIMGNNDDIDPAKYGQTPHAKTQIEQDSFRATFEETLVLQAMQQHIPLLGICGGMQRINVVLGGTLNQHKDGHNQGDIPGFESTHTMTTESGTHLATLAGAQFSDNSFHHQSVDTLGRGLRMNAKAADGTPKGFETDPHGIFHDRYVMGVQWHPEFGASDASAAIINDLVAQAKAHQHTPKPVLRETHAVIPSGAAPSLAV